MSTHIEVQSTASRLSAMTRSVIDKMRDSQEELQQVKDIYEFVAAGGDFAALGVKLGVTMAEAEVVYNLVTGAITPVTSNEYNLLIDRVG